MSVQDFPFSELLNRRNSTRGFLDRPLPEGMLAGLLALARRAPSGANLQPGEFTLLEGDARARLSTALVAAFRAGKQEPEDYSYFPQPMPQSLRRRQVAAAKELYGALQTGRDDRAGRDRQFERNFNFFDAPAALLVTIDARMGSGCYMDLGMCLYGLMLAATAQGLGSCAIGALASYPGLIRSTLGLGDEHHIVCGLALGYADPDAPENTVRTERLKPEEFFRTLS
ncbi:nitroreductase [Herbaspirillum sp. CF444]|uniref:nitroreductase n=1 Tax=Herbaspirillum sp. CF444 TaxID=1144319 RepID=UPI00027233CC|nr:nitroreductase [Herbaspirillum sp. CF444]EJL88227.1 nitroreductase [Herbaspirillum sp. CF444]